MIWVWLAAIAALGMLPTLGFVWRGGKLRGRRDAALALHRAQLLELDRDLAQGRLLDSEHSAARLEVQRRLLAESDAAEQAPLRSGSIGIVFVAAAVPAAALVMYVAAGGVPDYTARSAAATQALSAGAVDPARDEAMVARLREALVKMDPRTDVARRGYVMLGRAELSLGHLPEAASAWRMALDQHFEPDLGAETAEVITETEGHVTAEAGRLFRRALAEAPGNAPWRKAAEQRVSEAGGS